MFGLRFSLKIGIFIATVLFSSSPATAKTKVYKVAIAETGFVPFSFPESTKKDGIFMKILREIGAITGDQFVPVFAPTKRIKAMFEKGEIDIEPGINPIWRKDQEKISIYSEPFTTLTERLMFHTETGALTLKNFASGTVKGAAAKKANFLDPKTRFLGAVHGYFYPKVDFAFKSGHVTRVDAGGEEALVKMLHNRRVDAIVISEIPGNYHVKQIKNSGIIPGEATEHNPVMFRIHKNHNDLRIRINSALKKLTQNGKIAAIIKSM